MIFDDTPTPGGATDGAAFGTALRAARTGRDLTQRDAAMAFDLSPQFYNDMEHGRRTPGDDLADQIEREWGVAYRTPREERIAADAYFRGRTDGLLPAHGPTRAELDAACRWVTEQAGPDDPTGLDSNHKYALFAAVEGYLAARGEGGEAQ